MRDISLLFKFYIIMVRIIFISAESGKLFMKVRHNGNRRYQYYLHIFYMCSYNYSNVFNINDNLQNKYVLENITQF